MPGPDPTPGGPGEPGGGVGTRQALTALGILFALVALLGGAAWFG